MHIIYNHTVVHVHNTTSGTLRIFEFYADGTFQNQASSNKWSDRILGYQGLWTKTGTGEYETRFLDLKFGTKRLVPQDPFDNANPETIISGKGEITLSGGELEIQHFLKTEDCKIRTSTHLNGVPQFEPEIGVDECPPKLDFDTNNLDPDEVYVSLKKLIGPLHDSAGTKDSSSSSDGSSSDTSGSEESAGKWKWALVSVLVIEGVLAFAIGIHAHVHLCVWWCCVCGRRVWVCGYKPNVTLHY
jgi:hypothetical protein